eukprot:CAMPEP_0172725728 /NCGR_PEP_ID=MMETSP1074-20121228/89089_1 /TAXON_ID=2916 /ORGANISM="Ceratium fusus, Strain PA161109" /LENGTH=181 /DNA_ID=CAMNT_0013552575 /DNA_START=27 /DNA_END=573 /DNA_ORIENTATION=-
MASIKKRPASNHSPPKKKPTIADLRTNDSFRLALKTSTLEMVLAENKRLAELVTKLTDSTVLSDLVNQVKDLTCENQRLNNLLRSTYSEKNILIAFLKMLHRNGTIDGFPSPASPLPSMWGCLGCWQTVVAATGSSSSSSSTHDVPTASKASVDDMAECTEGIRVTGIWNMRSAGKVFEEK